MGPAMSAGLDIWPGDDRHRPRGDTVRHRCAGATARWAPASGRPRADTASEHARSSAAFSHLGRQRIRPSCERLPIRALGHGRRPPDDLHNTSLAAGPCNRPMRRSIIQLPCGPTTIDAQSALTRVSTRHHVDGMGRVIRRSSAVEQLTVNQLVVGSIPTAGANPQPTTRAGRMSRLKVAGPSLVRTTDMWAPKRPTAVGMAVSLRESAKH